MARGGRRSSHLSQTHNIQKRDGGVSRLESRPPLGPLPRSSVSPITSKASENILRRAGLDLDGESLHIEIYSNNRVFHIQTEPSKRVECRGLSENLVASLREEVSISIEKSGSEDKIVEASSVSQTALIVENNQDQEEDTSALQLDEPPKRKKRSVPSNEFPIKRNKPNLPLQPKPMKGWNEIESREDIDFERVREEDEDEVEDEDEPFEGVTYEKRGARVSELDAVINDLMSQLQQKGLKRIIKIWLGKCHTKKQASFPYNGGKTRDPASNSDNAGLSTTPDYWPKSQDHPPAGVRYKEPDHLYKDERNCLCKHLLRAGDKYTDAKFPLNLLEESTKNSGNDYPSDFRPDAQKVKEALYFVRRKEIEYENGEIDADTIIYVDMRLPRVRRPRKKRRPKRASEETTKRQKKTPTGLSGFLGPNPNVNDPPSTNSSFTSDFGNGLNIESRLASPVLYDPPSTMTSRSPVTADMEAFNPRDFLRDPIPSNKTRDDRCGARYSVEITPCPSKGNTVADEFDPIQGPESHVDKPTNQAVTVRLSSDGQVDQQKPSTVAIGRPITTQTFNRCLPSQQIVGRSYPTTTTEQRQAPVGSSPHTNPTNTVYASRGPVISSYYNINHTRGSVNNVPPSSHQAHFSNIPNTHQPAVNNTSGLYSPYPPHPGPNNHIIVPRPTPRHNPSFAAPASLSHQAVPVVPPPNIISSYPSVASSDFNGAMPMDSAWHMEDNTFEYFYDGTYQTLKQRNAANTPPVLTGNHQGHPQAQHGPQQQKGVSSPDIGAPTTYYATEWDAMAHMQQPQPTQVNMPHMGPPLGVAPGVLMAEPGRTQGMSTGYGDALPFGKSG